MNIVVDAWVNFEIMDKNGNLSIVHQHVTKSKGDICLRKKAYMYKIILLMLSLLNMDKRNYGQLYYHKYRLKNDMSIVSRLV